MRDSDIDVLGVEMTKADLALLREWLFQPEAKLFARILEDSRERARTAACRMHPTTPSYDFHIMELTQFAAMANAYENVMMMPEIIKDIEQSLNAEEKP